jgi:putative addiction module component (TIGR02574 family)
MLMSIQLDQLTTEALALSIQDRLTLAQRLFDSVDPDFQDAPIDDVDDELIAEINRRDAEIESGAVQTFSHEEVMQAVRKAIEKR